MSTYRDKIISLDVAAAEFGGRLEAKAVAVGYDPDMADATIAGIAKAQDLHVITLNAQHFRPFGIDASCPDDVIRIG